MRRCWSRSFRSVQSKIGGPSRRCRVWPNIGTPPHVPRRATSRSSHPAVVSAFGRDRLLESRPRRTGWQSRYLNALGLVSYSICLVHSYLVETKYLLVDALQRFLSASDVIVYIALLFISAVTYSCIEAPGRRFIVSIVECAHRRSIAAAQAPGANKRRCEAVLHPRSVQRADLLV